MLTIAAPGGGGPNGPALPPSMVFGPWSERVITAWVLGGLRCGRSYRSLLKVYLAPEFGDRALANITRREYRAFVSSLHARISRRGRPLAPRTLRNIVALAHALGEQAIEDGELDENPFTAGRRDLPAATDADPEWRSGAVYRRGEILRLMCDRRVELARRVAIAIHVLTGARSGEVSAARWTAYDASARPLGRLVFAYAYSTADKTMRRTKTSVAYEKPVHPFLAALLELWRAEGWREAFGRAPKASDLIVPQSIDPVRPLRNDGLHWRLKSACALLGIRFRSPHCLRATFVTLTQEDGAPAEVIESITHPSPEETFRGYSRFSWAARCRAVARLRLDPRRFV